MMEHIRHIIYLAALLLSLVPSMARAQFGFDMLSVEALIDDHKRIRSILAARSSLEQSNELLHQYSMDATVDYDSLNVKLDKYTKCFDIIDVIYHSGVMIFNVKNTYDDVSDKVAQLERLLRDFTTEFTLQGNIVSSDAIVIDACQRAVAQIEDDSRELYASVLELAQYATGKREMTTAQLITTINSINDGLDDIRGTIDHTYFVVYKYIMIRRSYFKRSLFRAMTLREMAHDAFSRWRRVTREIGY